MAFLGRWNNLVFIFRNNVDHLLCCSLLGLIILRLIQIDIWFIFLSLGFIGLQEEHSDDRPGSQTVSVHVVFVQSSSILTSKSESDSNTNLRFFFGAVLPLALCFDFSWEDLFV